MKDTRGIGWMMSAVRRVTVAFVVVLSAVPAWAQQDSPLSANFDLPVLINPARCGLNGETVNDYTSNHAANLNYKTQMNGGFTNRAIRVLSASYNALLLKRTMAVGLDVYTNTLNGAAISDFSVHLTYAYHWVVGKDAADNPVHRVSFGLQAGFRRWAIDVGRLQPGSMYDPAYSGGINPAMAPIYDFDEVANTVFDLQAGVYYTGWVAPGLRVTGSLSGYHLNRAQTGLGTYESRTPIRFAVSGGITWRNRSVPEAQEDEPTGYIVSPDLMSSEIGGTITFSNQGTYNLLEIAALYRLYLCADLSLGAGIAYRMLSGARVFSPMLALDISRFSLNLQCDLNLGTGGGYTNIFAIGLGYRF